MRDRSGEAKSLHIRFGKCVFFLRWFLSYSINALVFALVFFLLIVSPAVNLPSGERVRL